jgi:hypothetical protein
MPPPAATLCRRFVRRPKLTRVSSAPEACAGNSNLLKTSFCKNLTLPGQKYRLTVSTPDDPLARAQEQAARSTPPARAAAMLRIARVQLAFDRGQARITFEMGLRIRVSSRDATCEFLLDQARLLAAAVAPNLLDAIPSIGYALRQISSEKLGRTMLDHGHVEAAFEYVIRYKDGFSFPFASVSAVMQRLEDQGRRLEMLRYAIEP